MYMLMPAEPPIGFVTLAVMFVPATLLGFASHAPGGIGVFDAAMLVGLAIDRRNCSRACCCSGCSTTSSRSRSR